MSSPPKASSAEPSPVDVFLRATLRSGLLDAPQLQQALNATPSAIRRDAQELANYMVKVGHLSRFQAHKLLQGVSIGLVLGPFHLLAQIGRGGMGAVYLARDTRNQGLVAVKVLPPKRAKAQERLLARFRREMEICQRVSHPNLTRTFEVGVHQEVNYIAMEYIPGKNLYRLVHERGPLDVPRAARLFAEVADGLEHAHDQGLIHRDLKPSNIIVTPADHAKVLDLGLALIQGEIAEERTIVGGQGYVVGTMDYLAPEQAEDPFGVDARSDLYSLGATIYFTLVGQPPFPGGNALQKMLRHRTEEPVPLRSLQPSIPAGFEALVNKMMAKEPAQRFANAVELRAALQPWIGEIPVGAAVGPPRVASPPAPPAPGSAPPRVVPAPPPPPVVAAPAPPPSASPPAAAPAPIKAATDPGPALPPPATRPAAPAAPAAAVRPAQPPPPPARPAGEPGPAVVVSAPAPAAPVEATHPKVRAPAPVIPLATPVEEPTPAPPVPLVVSPLRDPRFAGGGAETMKISRGALFAGALAADGGEPIPAAAPPPIPEPPAPNPPEANPFAFDDSAVAPPLGGAPGFEPAPVPVLAPAIVAVLPTTTDPTVAPGATLDTEAPFWFDFLLPVAGAGVVLLIVWTMLLALLIQ